MTTKKTKTKSKGRQPQNNANVAYGKVVEAISKYQKDYLDTKFKDCYPQAQEISKQWTETVWNDAMKIMQDFPSAYTKNAAICFFAFAGMAIDSYLFERFHKDIKQVDLPVVLPVEAKSDMIKMLLERGEKELNTEGQELLKNLLLRDFGYFFAILKALRLEDVVNNLLISGFRMYFWEIMIPHLFATCKKEGEENATTDK